MDINTKAARVCRLMDMHDMWIPVETELPDNHLPVLVTIGYKKQTFISLAEYWGTLGWCDARTMEKITGVLAWQETPIPYVRGGLDG